MEGVAIALVEDGNRIEVGIPGRSVRLAVADEVIAARRAAMEAKGETGWTPKAQNRKVSTALRAYAAFATRAARGAGRDLDQARSAFNAR